MRRREIIVLSHELDRTINHLIVLAIQFKLSIDLLEPESPGRPRKGIGNQIDVYATKWPAEYDRSIADLQAQRAKIAAFVRVDPV
jgi:hypothetical protein